MDPRLIAIPKRLERVSRILAVTGGKGGIGKSLVASTLALLSAEQKRKTGLLDLDLTSPTDHLLLGATNRFPAEEFGIEPLDVHGVGFMSVALFVGERPTPLRGADVTNALVEILAVTRWGARDLLVVDMPPGLGDATLDAIHLLPRAEYLVVAVDSRLVLESVGRTLAFLGERGATVVGVVENMSRGEGAGAAHDLARRFGVPFTGSLPWDDRIEEAIGDPARLLRTPFAEALRPLTSPDPSFTSDRFPAESCPEPPRSTPD
jgi:ATP-binding protein involved in chromosome partitioning